MHHPRARSRREAAEQAPRRRPEVLRLLGRLPRTAPTAARPRHSAAMRRAAATVAASCRPDRRGVVGVAHAAASARSCCDVDDLGVRRAVREQLARACPCRRSAPPSSTTIWSASTMLDTRWATMITVASAVTGCSAARSRASVARSSAENESSNRKIAGRAQQRARDREPLALAAGDVRAALRDRRLEALAASPRRSRSPARPRARPTAPRRSRRGCRSAGCSRPCRRTGTAAAAPRRSAPTASSGSSSRTSTPSTQHRAAGRRRRAAGSARAAWSCPRRCSR